MQIDDIMDKLKTPFNLTKVHIHNGGTSIDDNPIVLAIEEHLDVKAFITPLTLYATDVEYGSPSWDKIHELKHAQHRRICSIGSKLWEWLNDWEVAWEDSLRPEPVTLEYDDNQVLNIKGDYCGVFDLKLSCDLDETGTCDCFVCENEDLDLELFSNKGLPL